MFLLLVRTSIFSNVYIIRRKEEIVKKKTKREGGSANGQAF